MSENVTTTDYFAQSRLLWTPPDPKRTRVDALRRAINHKHGLQLKDYHDLHDYSIRDYTFWLDVWEFLGIVSSVPPNPSKIIGPGRAPYLPTWFPSARLNYAENLLGPRAHGDDGVVLSSAREGACGPADVQHVTRRSLRAMTEAAAKALRAAGVGTGDRIALILTNSPTAVALGLGAASIGAILSPTAPDMGAAGVLERYRQIRPRLLVLERSYRYAGKRIDLTSKWREVANELKKHGLEKVVVVPGFGDSDDRKIDELPLSVSYKEFLALGSKLLGPLTFEQLSFDHPLYILYSSGTSGPPKCIIHSAGGSLLQNVKDAAVCFGMNRDETYFQFTTIGWVMWPFMLAVLGTGARIVAYDGSPFYPDVRDFLRFISEQRINVWGTSPRFLMEAQKQGVKPLEMTSFESLRMMFVTGAVLTPPQFEWTQRAFGPRVQIASGSGGTDICGGFVNPVETLPVYAGEIQGKALGIKVEIFDDEGRSIEDTGMPGELVCTRPHPTLPLGFWGDNSGEKLRKAYFDMYPGVWRQGDFIVKNPRTKGFMVLGRSDGVLNPSGVRFGSAEIYAVLDAPPAPCAFSDAIVDALCVGQRRAGRDVDERVFLFLKLRAGRRLTPSLATDIRAAIRKALSGRHIPHFVFEVKDVPYTVNGKRIELAVKRIISDGVAPPRSPTIANPEAFEEYFKFFEVEKLEGGDGVGTAADRVKTRPKL